MADHTVIDAAALVARWEAVLPSLIGQREIVLQTIAALSSQAAELERLTKERDEALTRLGDWGAATRKVIREHQELTAVLDALQDLKSHSEHRGTHALAGCSGCKAFVKAEVILRFHRPEDKPAGS